VPLKAQAYHLRGWTTAGANECRHKYASVQDDSIHEKMIAYMLSASTAFMAGDTSFIDELCQIEEGRFRSLGLAGDP